jgi:hypothetical protein
VTNDIPLGCPLFLPIHPVNCVQTLKAQDPLIQKLNIGRVLDRNDLRVATVWIDQYAPVFTYFRFLEGVVEPGDVSARVALRNKLQCKSFQWFLDEVCSGNQYVPDINPAVSFIKNDGNTCLDNGGERTGPIKAVACAPKASLTERIAGRAPQQWTHTSKGYLQSAFHVGNRGLSCMHGALCSNTRTFSVV